MPFHHFGVIKALRMLPLVASSGSNLPSAGLVELTRIELVTSQCHCDVIPLHHSPILLRLSNGQTALRLRRNKFLRSSTEVCGLMNEVEPHEFFNYIKSCPECIYEFRPL